MKQKGKVVHREFINSSDPRGSIDYSLKEETGKGEIDLEEFMEKMQKEVEASIASNKLD